MSTPRLSRLSFRKAEKRHRPHFRSENLSRAAARLKEAVAKAREYKRILQKGDKDALAEAVLLQGIISGDVISASILTRQKMQRENLRLRQRLAVQKLRESRAQQRLLEVTADRAERKQSPADLIRTIREIYGLPPRPIEIKALPPAE